MNEGVQDGLASNRLHELLIGVKATVEGLLATQSTNVWSTYGGLDRLCNNVEAVLMHQIILDQIANPGAHDYWPFILGLRWLRPLPASCIEQYLGPGALVPCYGQQGGASYPTTHAHGYGFTEEPSRGGAWLRHSLLNHNLSTQLQILLSDESYVAQHYNEDAFLRQTAHVHALVICLQAVEQNEPTLLAELDPSLLLNKPLHNRTGDSRRYTTGSLHKPAYRKTKHHDQERRKDEPLPVREVKETERTESTDQHELALQPESSKPRLVRSVSLPTILTPINSEEQYNKTDNILLTSNSDMLTIVSNSSDHIGGHHHAFKTLRRNNTESRLGCTGSLPLLAFSAHLIGPTPAQLHTSQECVQIPELSSSPSKLARKALVQALHNSGEETAFCDTEVKVLPESDVPDGVRMRRDSYNDELLSAEVSTCTELPPLVEKQSDIIETADNLENASTSSKSLLHSNNMDGINESTIPEGCSTDRVYQPRGSLHAEVSLLDVDEDGASNVEHDVKPSAEATHITNKQSSLYHKKIKHVRSMSDYGISDFQRQNEASGHNVDSMTRSVTGDHLDTNSLPHNLPLSYKHKERSGTMESLFQQPSKGQSLIGFLSSQDFHTCAELDKENAHFSICETLISAIEQIKCKQMQQSSVPAGPAEENMEGDSDEEIQDLKQRIRIRRRERLKEKAHEFPVLNDNKGEISVCSSSPQHSASQISRSYQSDIDVSDSEQFYSSESGSSSGDDILDAELSDREEDSCTPVSNLSSMKQSGLSLSMASMYSDADLRRNLMSPESLPPKNIAMTESNSSMSAEYIAISLLRKFSETQLPKASELQWLVSEKDTGQTLLPLPNSYPVSPDDETQIDQSTRLRGNMEWAPPRPQIIFNIHPAPKRKLILAKQNQRCAGCGARVETGYTKRYHYCDYLGKYFCPRCHTNSMAYIPARIVRRWDHTKRPVSNFARDLLSKVADDPLYDVYNINPTLNHKVKDLDVATECRQQLSHLSLFLQTCKQGQTLYEELKGLPSHWLNDITVYSLNELLQLKKKELVPQLKSLVMQAVQHVQKCQLCQARGFICELCDVNDIIYPYQLQTVVQCADCRTCFHRNCYVPGKCPKCARIEARKQMLANQHNQYDSYESSEEDT